MTPASAPAPKVTVYITNHNYGAYVDQAIRSVLDQSMQEFELIIIDDGSTDNSREVIECYAGDPRIRTIFQHNKGLNVTNNIALRLARGSYIMRLDADDYLDPNALLVLSRVLDREPDVGLVFPDYYHVAADGQILELVRRHDFSQVTLLDQPAHGACTLVRRNCLEAVGGYDESFSCQDGFDLWIRFVERYAVRNVNTPLFYYRQHGSNLTNNERRILDTRGRILARQVALNGHSPQALAIIPVRGATLDPRSDALRPLGGKPLIDWTIEAALGSKRLGKVLLTTPDRAILEHVEKWFPSVLRLKRDRRLAALNTDLVETLLHTLTGTPNDTDDIVAVLHVESPFRRSHDIDAAIDVMALFDVDSVIGVRPEIDGFFQHNGAGLVPVRSNNTLRLEREALYREAGQMHVVRRRFLAEKKCVIGGRIGHVVLDPKAALHMSAPFAWEMAETLLAGQADTNIKT